jgi:hypothetical protein
VSRLAVIALLLLVLAAPARAQTGADPVDGRREEGSGGHL